MSRGLDWEKVRREDRQREANAETRNQRRRRSQRQRKGERQYALHKFVKQHGLTCFRCGAAEAEWAKTGVSKRGPWVICVPCVTSPRPSG